MWLKSDNVLEQSSLNKTNWSWWVLWREKGCSFVFQVKKGWLGHQEQHENAARKEIFTVDQQLVEILFHWWFWFISAEHVTQRKQLGGEEGIVFPALSLWPCSLNLLLSKCTMSCTMEVTNCASTFKNKNKQKNNPKWATKYKEQQKQPMQNKRVMCLSSLLPSDMKLFATKLLVIDCRNEEIHLFKVS